MPEPRILVAEDDPSASLLMRELLEQAGWTCVVASDGEEAWRRFEADPEGFDVVVTDVRMPGINGIELCERIRRVSDVPIIITSVLARDEQVMVGIEAGADDYVTKPLNLDIMRAKVRRALERGHALEPHSEAVLVAGELSLDPVARVVTRAGEPLHVTRIEYGILRFLLTNKGRIVTPAQILQEVWGEEYETEVQLLRSAMTRLRRVIADDPSEPRYITTHTGMGYQLSDPDAVPRGSS